MRNWELSRILDFILYESSTVDGLIEECKDYLNEKERYYPLFKKLQKVKTVYHNHKKFSQNQKKGKSKGNRASWVDNIKFLMDYGNMDMALQQIDAAMTDFRVFHSRQTIWRFRKDLEALDISKEILDKHIVYKLKE